MNAPHSARGLALLTLASGHAALAASGASDETVSETAGLVAVAFPDADLSTLDTTRRAGPPEAILTTPHAHALLEASPNPVRGRAEVRYTLARAGEASLVVYDALGREVASLARGLHEAGSHAAAFDASGLAPGVYLVRLTAGDAADTLVRLTVAR